MERNSSGIPLVVASLILGASVVGASLLIRGSLDRASSELSQVLVAINAARPAAPAAAAPSRPGRPDPNKRYTVNTRGAPRKGAKNAKLVMVEFSDFQCPFCSRVGPTLEQVEKEYGDRVEIVFKHFPLSIHSKAKAAHAAAEAAHRQGKFWEMHDLIFANQREMSSAKYEEFAQQLGLDMDRFRKDAASEAVKSRVSADTSEGSRLGVTGTPSFFINGRFLSGAQPFDSFKRLIEEELREQG